MYLSSYKIVLKHFGTNFPIQVKFEIDEKGILISQLDSKYSFDWKAIQHFEENDKTIYFVKNDRNAFCIQKRGFSSEDSLNDCLRLIRNKLSNANQMPAN